MGVGVGVGGRALDSEARSCMWRRYSSHPSATNAPYLDVPPLPGLAHRQQVAQVAGVQRRRALAALTALAAVLQPIQQRLCQFEAALDVGGGR